MGRRLKVVITVLAALLALLLLNAFVTDGETESETSEWRPQASP